MNLIIIHRNERTLDYSVAKASKQADVHLVSEVPFYKSLRKAFKMAIENQWVYLIVLAADQIILPGAVSKLKQAIGNNFRVSGYGYDHLLMRRRMLAPSIYKVSLLKKALEIDASNQVQPESHILREMKKAGYPFEIIPNTLSIHDTEQYYRDIYRKGKAEANKFINYIINQGILSDLIKSDERDHKVFLHGILDHITNMQSDAENIIERLGYKEKQPL